MYPRCPTCGAPLSTFAPLTSEELLHVRVVHSSGSHDLSVDDLSNTALVEKVYGPETAAVTSLARRWEFLDAH